MIVKVTLKNGKVLEDELFDVDLVEEFLSLTTIDRTVGFDECKSVVDVATGKDMLANWLASKE